MKKTYKVKDNQTLKFNEVKLSKKDEDIKKDLMTESFNSEINIKPISTWEYGKPKKLAESKVFNYLSKNTIPIEENKEANNFLNNLHFIEDVKPKKTFRFRETAREKNHSISEVTINTKKVEDISAPYYLVQLKDTLEYLSMDDNGEGFLTKNKANAEIFVSRQAAEDELERFIFDSTDLDLGDSVSEEDSFDSVETFVAESKADFIIVPIQYTEITESLNHSISEVMTKIKEKSVWSYTNDVAFYIVDIDDDSQKTKYIGKEHDEDDDFIAVDYKDHAEAFDSEDDAQEAIDNMVYQELDKLLLDPEDDMAEHNKYEELSSKYRIEAVYINPDTLYYKPMKESKRTKKRFGTKRFKN